MSQDNSSKYKELPRFLKELTPIVQQYEKQLNEFKENPDAFQEEEEEEEQNQNQEDLSEDDDDIPGGEGFNWFQSSDDEYEESKKKDNNDDNANKENGDESKPQNHRKDISIGDAAEQRINAQDNKIYTEEEIFTEFSQFKDSRIKGKISTTTSHIVKLLSFTENSQLKKDLKLEVCFMVSLIDSNEEISIYNWKLVLSYLPELIDQAAELIILFDRLDRDFWARSIDAHILVSKDTPVLHSLYPKYIDLLKQYSNTLNESKDYTNLALALHLKDMLINHLYTRTSDDVYELAMGILKLSSDPAISVSNKKFIQIRAALYLAINLSLHQKPETAAEIVKGIPIIPQPEKDNSQKTTLELDRTKILYNRAIVYIALAAFEKGNYPLSAKSLELQENRKKISLYIGQSPNLIMFAPWQRIETNKIEIVKNLSIMMSDLPNQIGQRANEKDLIISSKVHKDLEREKPLFKPEDSYKRMISAIDKIKHGEWQMAWQLVQSDYNTFCENIKDRIQADFLSDLKKMALCVYLLIAPETFNSISIDALEKKFQFDNATVLSVIKKMREGFAPVTNAKIQFTAELIENDKFLSFEKVSVKSPLYHFGQKLQKKIAHLERVIPK